MLLECSFSIKLFAAPATGLLRVSSVFRHQALLVLLALHNRLPRRMQKKRMNLNNSHKVSENNNSILSLSNTCSDSQCYVFILRMSDNILQLSPYRYHMHALIDQTNEHFLFAIIIIFKNKLCTKYSSFSAQYSAYTYVRTHLAISVRGSVRCRPGCSLAS